MLDKFSIKRHDDGSFNVSSKISGNSLTVPFGESDNYERVLLWTILNDLHEEDHLKVEKITP